MRKKKILWASRHPMTAEQVADVRRLLDDVDIVTEAIVWTDIKSVQTAAARCDVLIAVFPQAVALRIGYLAGVWSTGADESLAWTGRIWTAESAPVAAAHGQERTFKHVRFVGADGIEVRS